MTSTAGVTATSLKMTNLLFLRSSVEVTILLKKSLKMFLNKKRRRSFCAKFKIDCKLYDDLKEEKLVYLSSY